MIQRKPMTYVVWVMVILLLVLHQDNWLWTDSTLVLGFLPVGLLYHMCISLAAGVTWLLAVRFAWPTELDTAGTPSEKGHRS